MHGATPEPPESRPRSRRSRRAPAGGPLESCPACDGTDFLVEERDEDVLFRCLGCAKAWRYGLGYVWPADPTDVTSQPRQGD